MLFALVFDWFAQLFMVIVIGCSKCFITLFLLVGETTVGQNDHDIKLNGALVAESHW